MPVQITVTDSKYFSEIKNGPAFSLNTGDFGTHLKGNLGERLKAELTVQIRWSMEMLRYDVTGGNTITLSSGSFFDNGFSVGDTANLSLQDGSNSVTFTVNSISADGKVMVTSGLAPIPNQSYGDENPDLLRGLTPLEGLKYKFNFIVNSDSTNFISALDETTLAYKTDGIRTAFPTPVVSTWNDTILGSQTGNHQVAFVQDVSDNGFNGSSAGLFPLNSIQEFKIEHEFILFPYFLDGELTNLENLLRPERIEAGVSLKHVIDFEFRSTLSNPNTAKTGRYDNVLGQTSYFNENFGDEPTQYSISGLTLTAGGSPVTGVDAINTTTVSFSVLNADGVTNPFLTSDPVVAYVSKLQELEDYNASTTDFASTWLYESLRGVTDAAPNSGTIINNLDVDLISTTQIDVTFDITYTAGQQALIEEGDNYLIAFGVGDAALSTDLSNKSILKVNVSEYLKNQDVPNLMDVQKLEVYTHPMTFTEGVTQGYTGFKGWVQDGIMWDWEFTLDRVLLAKLERFRVRLVALKTTDDTFFPLEDVEYDLSQQVVTPGPPTIQQIEIDDTRGFPLVDGSIFNLKTFKTGTYSAPDITYTGQTAFKVNWQEWLALDGADTVFYDPSEPNNGLNQKASQYSLKDGYEIRVLIDADVSNEAVTTNYIFKSPNAVVLDFEEQDGTPISWTSIKETFDTQGANLNQEILTNEDTNIKITFTPDIAPGLASLYWGIIRIEEANQPGTAICELSTFRPSKDNNILKPLPGESFTKLSLNATVLCLECAIDYTKLDPAKSYNVYGRLGLLDQTPIPVPTIKVVVAGTTIQKDADFFVFRQTEVMVNSVLKDNFFNTVEGDYIFKIATNAVVGGAPYDKATWGAVSAEADFTGLANEMAASSDKWVYIEQTNTAYTIEGLIIEFERISLGQSSTVIVYTMPVNSIDQDIKIWSDRKWTAISATTGGSIEDGTQMALRTLDTTGEDWTLFPAKVTFGFATVNAVLAASVEGVPHCLHIYRNFRNGGLVNDITIEMEYASTEDVERSIDVFQGEIRPEWRPFGNCADWGPFPNADQPYATTDPLDTALLDLLDIIQFGNPFTLSFWVMTRTGLAGNDRQILWTPFNQGLAAAEGGVSAQLAFNTITGGKLLYALTENGGASTGAVQDWDGAYPSAQRTHVVVTSDGSFNGPTGQPMTGVNMWINGRRNLAGETNFSASTGIGLGGAGTSRPSDSMYYHGRWSLAGLGFNKQPERTERIQVFDKELTAEEVLELYHDIDAARGGAPTVSNLFRDWDFANHAGGVVTDLTGSGFDMTISTGGAQPSNPSFY